MKAIGHLRTTLVLGAIMAAGLLTLTAVEPAGAAFPGSNGKIAFTSNRDGLQGEIYTMNADGTNQIPLTANTNTDAEPALSPDGTKIAFTSNQQAADGTTDREIWVMNADGKGTQLNLTNAPGDDEPPAWSPDGKKIAFRSNRTFNGDNDYDVWVANADGTGTPTNLHNNLGDDSSPSWSPDGTKLAFERGDPGVGMKIFTINADGSGLSPVTDTTPGGQRRPSFSPDGKKVAFFDETSGEILTMNADGSGRLPASRAPAPTTTLTGHRSTSTSRSSNPTAQTR